MLLRKLLRTSFCHAQNFLCPSFHEMPLFKNFCASKYSSQPVLCEPLSCRHILSISGPDASEFLQGMITNDVQNLHSLEQEDKSLSCMYSMFLCTKGKVLYDTLLYKIAEKSYLLECDVTAVPFLQKYLDKFKLRKKLNINLEDDMRAWTVTPTEESFFCEEAHSVEMIKRLTAKQDVITAVRDPRVPELGYRVVMDGNVDLRASITDLPLSIVQNTSYDVVRYKLGVGEGVADHPPGACFPFECNIDFLHGISFQKGCYVGQEHTARVRHTGVVRKRLMPVVLISSGEIKDPSVNCTIVNKSGTKVGKLRYNVGPHGLAILNVQDSLKSEILKLADHETEIKVTRPSWWPQVVDERGFIPLAAF